VNSLSDFDLGPLTWVKGEIDVALNAGAAALEAWNGEDLTPLKEAATYLHQVSGALQIVDLQGVYQVNNAIEGLLADMQVRAELRSRASAALALKAMRALQGYLDALMAGAPNTELSLTPVYAEVQVQRGAEPPPPSELFHPDVGTRARRPTPELPMDDASLARALRSARFKYQKGLLQFLRDKDAKAGLIWMDEAVRDVERLAPGPAQYTFWWTVGGLLDAMRRGGVVPDIWTKKMFGRVDMQMRRLMEGSRQLAERLFRDVLYYLLQDGSPAGRAAEVRALFELERYLPPAVTGPSEQEASTLRPLIAALRDAVNAAKEQWMRLCAGRREAMEPFRVAAGQIAQAADGIADAALVGLGRGVRDAAAEAAAGADVAQNEALQVEMATALLLLQHAAENYFKLGRDFGDHAGLQAERLRAAVAGGEALSAVPGVPLLDEIARQAQERLLLGQVTREIQTNLRQVEEILDKFFRNHAERANLPLVPGLLKQIQGALNILQLNVAAELVQATAERVGLISAGPISSGGRSRASMPAGSSRPLRRAST